MRPWVDALVWAAIVFACLSGVAWLARPLRDLGPELVHHE